MTIAARLMCLKAQVAGTGASTGRAREAIVKIRLSKGHIGYARQNLQILNTRIQNTKMREAITKVSSVSKG